jgi:hypothetical protein
VTTYQAPIAVDWPVLSTVNAAGLNTGLRDPLKFFRSRPQAVLTRNAAATITSVATYTRVIWDATLYDTNIVYAAAAPSYAYAQCPGYYLVYAKYTFGNYAGGYRALQVRQNAQQNPAAGIGLDFQLVEPVPGTNTILRSQCTTYMYSQDRIELFVYQTSGATQNVVTGVANLFVGLLWLGA